MKYNFYINPDKINQIDAQINDGVLIEKNQSLISGKNIKSSFSLALTNLFSFMGFNPNVEFDGEINNTKSKEEKFQYNIEHTIYRVQKYLENNRSINLNDYTSLKDLNLNENIVIFNTKLKPILKGNNSQEKAINFFNEKFIEWKAIINNINIFMLCSRKHLLGDSIINHCLLKNIDIECFGIGFILSSDCNKEELVISPIILAIESSL